MRDLTADDILSLTDRPIVPVDIPEWKGRVYVRGVSAAEMDAVLNATRKVDGDFHSRFAAMVACDAEGKRLFSVEQVKQLREKLYRPIRRIVEAGEKINGMIDVKKNSAPDNGRGSGSTSPSPSAKR